MSVAARIYYTPQEYLALEREAEYKSEYVNGQIYAMSGASREHNQIVFNLARLIGNHILGGPCVAYVSDMRVRVSPTGMYTYPDVVAVCDEPRFEDEHVDTLLNPTLIIEVLSPSTEAYDRGEKFAHYRKLGSLVEYVLVSQDKARVEHFIRHGERGDKWILTEVSGMDGTLRLTSVGCELALMDMYDRVTFPDDSATPSEGAGVAGEGGPPE